MSSDSFGSVGRVVRGGFWLYGVNIINSVSGFLYWLVISILAGSETLGFTSATVGLATLIIGLLSLGIQIGLRRFLGRCIGLGDRECLAKYLWTSILFTTTIYLVAGFVLHFLGFLGIGLWSYTPEMLRIASIIVLLGVFQVMQAFLVSILRTDMLFLGYVIGNILRFGIGVGLVYHGLGWVGAAVGYMLVYLTVIIVSVIHALRFIGFRLVLARDVLVDDRWCRGDLSSTTSTMRLVRAE